jgi:hypothetical protein
MQLVASACSASPGQTQMKPYRSNTGKARTAGKLATRWPGMLAGRPSQPMVRP